LVNFNAVIMEKIVIELKIRIPAIQ
jgi:hypothetical protein